MLLNNVVFKHSVHGYCRADIFIENEIIKKIHIYEKIHSGVKGVEYYVTQGFVNSHLHPNQLFDRRLMDELSITELLHVMHKDYQKDDEDRYAQAAFVLMDAIKSGATSIYAVASHPLPVLKAFKTLGVKGAVSCFYNDQWEGHGTAPSLSFYQGIEEKFNDIYREKSEKIDIHIGTASVQSASNDLLMLMNDLAVRLNTKVNLHVSEGIECVHTCLKSRGNTPVRLLHQLGILAPHWNLIHAVNIDEEEISLIAKSGAHVIHCPVSNAKTGVGIAPIKSLLMHGVNIALGTDACSNNNTNNILNEAYFASLLQHAFHQSANLISIDRVMHWLTTGGHQILGTQQKTKIEEGATADLLLWSLAENAFVPLPYGNFDAALIYNAPDIKPHSVLIDGKVIVENYQLKDHGEELIRDIANDRSMKIISSFSTKEKIDN